MARKNPQSSIDALLSRLPSDVVAEFMEWARFGPTGADIQARLNEMGRDHDALERLDSGEQRLIAISAVQKWYRTKFPIGDQAILINALANPYVGVDARSALNVALGSALNLLNLSVPKLDDALLTKLAAESPESLFHNTLLLIKEIRSAAGNLNALEVIKQRSELELAGGYRVAQILLNMAKDKPQEAILNEYIDGALKQLETEV